MVAIREFIKELDREIEGMCREWEAEGEARRVKSNMRLFRLVGKMKGKPFLEDLNRYVSYIRKRDGFTPLVVITRKAGGLKCSDSRWKTGTSLLIQIDALEYVVSVEIREGRFLQMRFPIK